MHGLESLVDLHIDRRPDTNALYRLIKFSGTQAGIEQKQQIYRLVEQCLFPELFGSPPNDFFDDYFLDERTGNYIPFDQVNAVIQPVDVDNKDIKTAAAPMQDADTGSAAAAAFPRSTSFTASSSSAAAAAAAKKGGRSARMYPFSIPMLF
jgi:hypothetical protein